MLSRLTVRRIYLSIAVATLFSLTALVPLTNAANGGSVAVSNVEELYAAVDDPNNAGTSVTLAPGTYTLSRNRPDGSLRTKAGRLELQPDMSLTGVVGNRSAVVIDGSGLPASSFSLPALFSSVHDSPDRLAPAPPTSRPPSAHTHSAPATPPSGRAPCP